VKSRLSFVTSLGALVAVAAGLTPACGSDGGKRLGNLIDDEGGIGGAGGRGNPTGDASFSTGGKGGATGASTLIGQKCVKDADCGTQGLTCIAANGDGWDGAGVSNGICTLDCSADLVADPSAENSCSKFDKTAICLGLTVVQATCVESCTLGDPDTSENKCHNRKDMACADPEERGLGYCQPTCRGDFDCGKDRVCDLGNGTCVEALDPARKLPIGSKCDPKAKVDPCQGACVGFTVDADAGSTTTLGFCSGLCKLGEQNGCGFDPQAATVDAFCLYQPSQASGFGDVGFCGQLCDCNDDCRNPDFICSGIDGLADLTGHDGVCGPSDGPRDTGIACSGTRPKPDSGKPVTVPEAGPGTDAGTTGTGGAPADAGRD
jgi:hypothetical protein